jgi:hypothetical protein
MNRDEIAQAAKDEIAKEYETAKNFQRDQWKTIGTIIAIVLALALIVYWVI